MYYLNLEQKLFSFCKKISCTFYYQIKHEIDIDTC